MKKWIPLLGAIVILSSAFAAPTPSTRVEELKKIYSKQRLQGRDGSNFREWDELLQVISETGEVALFDPVMRAKLDFRPFQAANYRKDLFRLLEIQPGAFAKATMTLPGVDPQCIFSWLVRTKNYDQTVPYERLLGSLDRYIELEPADQYASLFRKKIDEYREKLGSEQDPGQARGCVYQNR